MNGQPTQHNVPLTASLSGNTVTVTGNGSANLPKKSGAHRFDFTLSDSTGLNVKFDSLDTEDDCSTCPPASGQNSTQIDNVTMQNNGPNKRAGFIDKNDNKKEDMPVSYQWNFTCDDPGKTVEPFDPIIINGGGA